ncbi:hypothetical protein B7463_g1297, partial [Scytalidium lignicola]
MPGNQERLLVTSPEALKEILVSKTAHFVKPQSVKHRLSRVTGNGLLIVEGEEHKAQRKSLMPAFSFRHIKDLYPIFWSKARELVICLEKEVNNNKTKETKVTEVRGWATRTTLDIIGLAGMDHDFNSLQNPNNSLARRPIPISRRVAALLSILPTRQKKQVSEASNYIRDLCRNIIQEKQEKLKTDQTEDGVDIIAVALKSNVFTDENLVDQMMTFLAAGHGTTSHALQWAVYALCKHDKIQARLREEIRDKLPPISDPESKISAPDIDALPFLHAFCNEILRFYAPVPATVRQSLHETTVVGYRIPKGTSFTIAPGVVNLDKELWGPDADTFNPERWMQDGCVNSGGVKNNYGFLTFLHGPRSCIGETFARSELACLVAAIVGRFRMELEDPDKEVKLMNRGIGLSPADGVRAKFEIVDGW